MGQAPLTANHSEPPVLILTKYLEYRHKFRSAATIQKLYEIDRLSAREIADKIGCGHTSINRALRKAGVAISARVRRPRFGRPSPRKSSVQLTSELRIRKLVRRLHSKGQSFREIAELFTKRGVTTPSGRGVWRHATVKRLLEE